MKAFSLWYHDSSRLLGLCWKSTHQNITKLETTFKLVFTTHCCLLTTIHYHYFATTYMSTLEKAVEKHFFSNTLWFCSPFKKAYGLMAVNALKKPNSSSQRRSEQQAFWKFNFRTRVILLFFRSSVARTHTKFPFDPYPKLTYNAHSFINAEMLNFDL